MIRPAELEEVTGLTRYELARQFRSAFGTSPDRYSLMRRLDRASTVTRTFGTCYPRDGLGAGIRLIDWDSWRIGRPAFDLAYMMAVHWYPERRARLEASLLERYHATLCAHGVTGYGLDRLREDYRLLVIARLTTPVWQQSFGLHAMIWWPHLNRIVAAFEDLDCEELVG